MTAPLEIPCGPCVIRTFRAEDAESVARHANDRRIWLNTSNRFPHPYTVADAVAFIESAHGDPRPVRFAIDVEGRAVGGIGLRLGEDIAYRSAELGYWVGVEYWGRGIATAAVPVVTRYGFEELDLLRIFAHVFQRNAASARVLEKCGYQREGVLRSSAVKDGEVLDEYLYASVREG